jgi:hypothetical protein
MHFVRGFIKILRFVPMYCTPFQVLQRADALMDILIVVDNRLKFPFVSNSVVGVSDFLVHFAVSSRLQ